MTRPGVKCGCLVLLLGGLSLSGLRADPGLPPDRELQDLRGEQERLRQRLPQSLPSTAVSFEAGDVVSQIMNFGAPTPIEVAVSGADLAADRAFAEKVLAQMRKVPPRFQRGPSSGQAWPRSPLLIELSPARLVECPLRS